METRYIKITEYCDKEKVDISFLLELAQEGILHIERVEEIDYLNREDLRNIEMFSRWHYDLGVNTEGIDAMRHMLQRIREMQNEIQILQRKLDFF
ncbi:MAG: chaperone modulator CbpM [Flavobacteriaceae bacterium]|nr:chaperone modulator CbpM [Flavobacteriaceae bacterium]